MATRKLPDQSWLRERFDYDPESGVLTWRKWPRLHFKSDGAWKTWNTRFAGNATGCISTGRPRTRMFNENYFSYRLIWKWMTGEEPPETIDHIDGDPSNNRWNNLRAATRKQNVRNRGRRPQGSLPKGVYPIGLRWRASITVNYRGIHLGTFDTIDEAHRAYIRAAKEHFGEFANPGHD